MDATAIIGELVEHMEWADAVVFSAIIGKPQAEEDEVLLRRLRHIHLVQNVFFDVWQNQPINPHAIDSFNALELAGFAERSGHASNSKFLDRDVGHLAGLRRLDGRQRSCVRTRNVHR